jgi:hypothetical protein
MVRRGGKLTARSALYESTPIAAAYGTTIASCDSCDSVRCENTGSPELVREYRKRGKTTAGQEIGR